MLKRNFTNSNFITKQLKLLLEVEKLIDISDPVYTGTVALAIKNY